MVAGGFWRPPLPERLVGAHSGVTEARHGLGAWCQARSDGGHMGCYQD